MCFRKHFFQLFYEYRIYIKQFIKLQINAYICKWFVNLEFLAFALFVVKIAIFTFCIFLGITDYYCSCIFSNGLF